MSERLVVAERIRTARGVPGNAVLVRDDRVAEIGSAEDLRRPDLTEDRYPGGVIVPGLRDAHFHPVGYAGVLARPSLRGAADLEDLLTRLREADDRLPPGSILVAHHLDDEGLAERRLPTRADLDPVIADRPVLLIRSCGHVGVVNTAALEAAGVGPDDPDPPGGSFDRGPDGRLTGVLRETTLDRVGEGLEGAEAVAPEAFLGAMGALTTLGLTGIGAIVAGRSGPWCGDQDDLGLICAVGPDLPLHLGVLVVARSPRELEEAVERVAGAGRRVRFVGMKAFSDGSLGGHTAALRHPYHDRPETTGTLRLEPGLAETARACLAMGGKVAVHAIGDLAVARVLDLFEDLLEAGAAPEDLRVEHASVLTDADVERFARLGVTASVQPAFLPSETGWLEKRLGPDRLRLAYRFRTLSEAEVPLAGGSDCPVEPPSPFWGMAAARDRAGIVPEEALGPEDAFRLFTEGAAASLGEPAPLSPGAPADFAVLDRDPVTVDPDGLRQAGVLSTWIGGTPADHPGDTPAWVA